MINPLRPRLLPDPSDLRWPTVNSGCAHTDPLASITITRSAIRYLKRTPSPPRRLRSRLPSLPPFRGPRATLAALLALALLTLATVSTAAASTTPPDTPATPTPLAAPPTPLAAPPSQLAAPPSPLAAPPTSLGGPPSQPGAPPSQPDTVPVPPGFTGPTARFSWPLPAPHPVLRPFQAPATPYGPGHRGVDLGGSVGEPVFAAGDGLVLYAGALFNCDLISIEHPGGLRTTYTPVVPSVRVGQQVTRRQQIGTLLAAQPGCPEEVGNDGTGPPVFLYWGVHRDRDYLDPLRLVATGEVRLLPWPGDDQ
jgi:murein DD-endopeptidase MepM/ murein hydrolase activator NlpD